jgi:hypothetical protein
MRALIRALGLGLAIGVIVVSFAAASAGALNVNGGTLHVFTINGGPDVGDPGVGGPDAPAECLDMTFAQTIVGTPGDDIIPATNGAAVIFGLGGNDTIAGGNGKDCIVGGEGDDTITGGNGRDYIDGGNGTDDCDGGDSSLNEIVNCETNSPGPSETIQPEMTPGATGTATPGPGETPNDRADLLQPCPDGADCVIYVIRAGDNLFSIVRFFDVPTSDTLALNPWLAEASHLPVGVDLRLPWPEWLPGRPGVVPPDPTPGEPSADPTPSAQPSAEPTASAEPAPTAEPTPADSPSPTADPAPTADPPQTPSPSPAASPDPTAQPTAELPASPSP